MVDIPSTQSDGNFKVLWVPAIANTAEPTVAELTGVGVVDLSCYLTEDGFTPGLDQATIEDKRICTKQNTEKPGRGTRSLETAYIDNTNQPSKPNDAQETLVEGTAGNIVTRRGKAQESAIVATDVVDVWPVECGMQNPQPPVENTPLRRSQKMFVVGKVQLDVAVVA